MLLCVHHEGRIIRIECPDNARVYTNAPDVEDCLVIPDPDYPERGRYLLTPFLIRAAERGDHGLRLIKADEAG